MREFLELLSRFEVSRDTSLRNKSALYNMRVIAGKAKLKPKRGLLQFYDNMLAR